MRYRLGLLAMLSALLASLLVGCQGHPLDHVEWTCSTDQECYDEAQEACEEAYGVGSDEVVYDFDTEECEVTE